MFVPKFLKKKVLKLKFLALGLCGLIFIFIISICISAYDFYRLYTTDINTKSLIHKQRSAELDFYNAIFTVVDTSKIHNDIYLRKFFEIKADFKNLSSQNSISSFDTLISLVQIQNNDCIKLILKINQYKEFKNSVKEVQQFKNNDVEFRKMLLDFLLKLDQSTSEKISNLVKTLYILAFFTLLTIILLYIVVLRPSYKLINKSITSIENKNIELICSNDKLTTTLENLQTINQELAKSNSELYIKETENLFIQAELKNALEESKKAKIEIENNAILLKSQREDLYDLYNNAPTGYFTLDKHGKIITVNKTALSWIGYTQSEVDKNNLFENYIAPISLTDYKKAFVKAVESGKFFGILLFATHKEGYEIAFSMNAFTLYDTNHEVAKIRCTCMDMRERLKHELELTKAFNQTETANKAKTQFLSIMSHELRTPIHGIVGNSSLLKNTQLNQQQLLYLQNIDKNSDFLTTIIQQILDYIQLDTHKIELHLQYFDIVNTIENTIKKSQNKITNTNVSIETTFENILSKSLISDVNRIEQVLYELITNSLKFTPIGKIEIKIKQSKISNKKYKSTIDIIDTGIGIEENEIQNIFIPFKQISENLNRESQGTGLGLAISQKIIHLLGGTIEVVCSEKNKGTHIRFTFEAKSEEQILEIQTKETPKKTINKKIDQTKILAVDDSDMNLMLINSMLKNLNFDVELALNGQVAFEMATKKHYDFILMDIQMPVMDGITATKEIQKYYQNDPIKPIIIAVTANNVVGDHESYLAAGMDDCLPKPLKQESLKNKLLHYYNDIIVFENKESDNDKTDDLIDHSIIEQIKETAAQLQNDLDKIIFEMAKNDIPKFIKEAEELYKLQNISDLGKILHKIKGAAWSSGLKKIGNICEEFEKELKNETYNLDFFVLQTTCKRTFIALENLNL